jgi:hypothetical protein
MLNKRLINTGEAAPAPLDPLQNFETVTYTGNGGTQKITGYIRKGAAFNGSSSFIDTNAKIPASLDFSVSFWMKSSDTSTGDHYIFGTKGNYATNGWFISNDAGYIRYGEGNGVDNATSQYSPSVVADGNWNHVVVTRAAGGTVNMYVNNSRVITDGSVGTYFMTSSTWAYDLHIGRYAASSILFYDGGLDQVRIFNTALNSTQVGQLALETYADSKKSTTDYFGDGSGIALYELDEGANDTGVPIDSGQSAVFNGSSSLITTPIGTAPSGGNSRTFSLWVNSTNTSSNQTLIMYGNANPPSRDFFVWRLNGVGSSTIEFADFVDTYSESASSVFDGGWHHLAFVYNGSTIQYYVDGSPLGSGYSVSLTTANTIMGIGDYNSAAGAVLDGKIDQVRIYSSALSASDVEALASETNVPTANLLAHYKLDGDATDETTNYNGTWGGTEAYSDPALLTAYNGTPTNINFLGMAFQPDLVWVKNRSVAVNHYLYDSIRGTGAAKALHSNTTDSEASASVYSVNGGVQSIDSNGFTAFEGTDGTYQGTNKSGNNYVAWCWKAGGTAVSNTNGTITSTVSANQDAGFSIVKYTTPSGGAGTVGHGLSTTPEIYITKRTDSTSNWYFNTTAIDGSLDYLLLNTTSAKTDSNGITAPTSTVFSASNFGTQGEEWITYCFHSVDGYQKVGSYSGGTANQTITTGFKPRWIMIKCTSGYVENWVIYDSVRSPSDPRNDLLLANVPNSEYANYSTHHINFNSDGFTLIQASSAANGSGGTYIYLAIA